MRQLVLLASLVWAGAVGAQEGRARLRGVVIDSVGRRPLPGAVVQLASASNPAQGWSATTDSLGAWQLGELAPGRYVVGFVHVALDSLGLEAPSLAVDLGAGQDREVTLAIPAARTLVARLCRADVTTDSTGLFLGRVRHVNGATAEGGLLATWTELRFTRQGLQRATPSQRALVAADGWFAMCGLPIRSPIAVRAWQGSDSTGYLELDIPPTGLLRRDLVVGRVTATVTTEVSSAIVDRGQGLPPTMRHDTVSMVRTARGTGAVRGTVSTITGAPLAGARIELWGTNLVTAATSDGAFALDSVPEGSQTLVVRGIGFVPYRAVIDVLPPTPTRHDVALAPFVAAMDTVRIVGQRSAEAWRTGYDQRRKRGLGEFIDEDELNRRDPKQVSDLFVQMPGVDILSSGAFGRKVVMRGRAGGFFCIPAIFVDGVRFFNGQGRGGRSPLAAAPTVTGNSEAIDMMEYTGTADLEFVVNPNDIKAVEVYPRDAQVPIEFDDPRDGCGSIVIWTGRRKR
ncbi:MAG: carboxypeptidase regulatory-like domain-containing protein [Gemmatimonadetes bacterium]|nr:carboxypeptidase regulatory-like domain-containing protein [Gemmatimonadota bacterium]